MKFRIYDSLFKQFLTDPHEWFIGLDGKVYFLVLDEEKMVECKQCIVQRATDVLDKNGNMIFEGDIVRSEDGESPVCWQNWCFSAKSNNGNNMLIWNDCEVVGNIFDA